MRRTMGQPDRTKTGVTINLISWTPVLILAAGSAALLGLAHLIRLIDDAHDIDLPTIPDP